MYAYQQNHRYFAQVAEGLEETAAEELKPLGGREIRLSYRGLYFEADQGALYRINLHSRLVTRVIAPLAVFTCHTTDALYRRAKTLPWRDFLGADQTLAVFANVAHSKIRHSRYAALCLKDAIVDYFREECGRRPDVERSDPDLWVSLFVENDRAVIGIDTSGGSLHRRGYRTETVEAPMQETVAAAIIRRSQWDGSRPLHDPMCGSGTLLAEALMHHCRIPAGALRIRFGFERLPDFDPGRWAAVKAEADGLVRPLPPGLIAGSDIAPEAVAAARANLGRLPHGSGVAINRLDFRRMDGLPDRVIVCNPPYGVRIQRGGAIGELYRVFGDFLKQRCRGSSAFIYFGNREMLKHIGLRPAWKQPIATGGLDGRLARFDLY
ncbi:MAG: THUMP domain-containing protein [Desulfobacterales bacterium]|jgi:putative N6-adenine-specific DNA methylase|nr:THUMP domain-containing protein [Desulfobacterales bacterium]